MDGRPAARGRRRRRALPRRPRDGDALRAHAARLARRLSAIGRHGFFHTYEAFAHVIDSMFNQHAKWLDICKNHVPWRASVASQNILLSSTVWRQDHNGFSHQDPGFIDVVTNKSPIGDPHLPAAGRQLPAGGRRPVPALDRLRQRHRGRQAEAPAVHDYRRRRSSTARRASASGTGRATTRAWSPTWCMASCGDVPTLEALAAAAILRERLPDLKVRFVNVVDLYRMQPASEHPHGLDRPRSSTACSPPTSR